jgi:hypothetical protein
VNMREKIADNTYEGHLPACEQYAVCETCDCAEIKLQTRITELEWALKDVIVMLDDPTGDDHVRDMRGATIIARAALKGEKT